MFFKGFWCTQNVNIVLVTVIIVNRGHIPINILQESGINNATWSACCEMFEKCDLKSLKEVLHHLLSMKPYEKWYIYHINWLAGFLPSTVSYPALVILGSFWPFIACSGSKSCGFERGDRTHYVIYSNDFPWILRDILWKNPSSWLRRRWKSQKSQNSEVPEAHLQ